MSSTNSGYMINHLNINWVHFKTVTTTGVTVMTNVVTKYEDFNKDI